MSSVSVILQVYAAATRMYFSNKLKPIRTDMLLLSWQTKDMELANISFRLLAISQVLLFILLVVCADNPRRIRVVGALLISGIIAYLLMPLVIFYTPYPSQVNYLWFVATMTPSLLLLFVWFIFEENRRLPQWIIALVSFSAGSSLWFELTNGGLPGAPWWLQATKIIISGLVIYVVWRGRDNDLVEIRSKVRNIFILVMAVFMIFTLSVEVITHFNPPKSLDTLMVFSIFIFSITMNYFFVKLNPSSQLMSLPTPAVVESEDPLISELLKRMRDERLYADHDLRVGSLASLLNIPEYKLRSKINQQLGYRNFNQFVNHYRIEEAGVKLRKDVRMPVLSIALDVGFRSISSFNSAFQTQFGISPTQYRAESAVVAKEQNASE